MLILSRTRQQNSHSIYLVNINQDPVIVLIQTAEPTAPFSPSAVQLFPPEQNVGEEQRLDVSFEYEQEYGIRKDWCKPGSACGQICIEKRLSPQRIQELLFLERRSQARFNIVPHDVLKNGLRVRPCEWMNSLGWNPWDCQDKPHSGALTSKMIMRSI